MAHSLAVLRVLEQEGGFDPERKAADRRRAFAGRILRAGRRRALHRAEAARLLKLRGQSMQKAVPAGEGAMAALLGADMAQATEICDEARRSRSRARAKQVVAAGQRQWRRPGGDLRPPGRGRARDRDRQGKGRPARHAAAGLCARSIAR